MKVNELIEQLKLLPEDKEVWMSSDPEGNEYRPVSEAQIMITYDHDEDFPEAEPYFFEPWDEMTDPPEEVIVIWPGYSRS